MLAQLPFRVSQFCPPPQDDATAHLLFVQLRRTFCALPAQEVPLPVHGQLAVGVLGHATHWFP